MKIVRIFLGEDLNKRPLPFSASVKSGKTKPTATAWPPLNPEQRKKAKLLAYNKSAQNAYIEECRKHPNSTPGLRRSSDFPGGKVIPTEQPDKSSRSKRAVELGLFVENIDMTTVLNRGHWICGICHKPIDPKLRHPQRMAGTIDHIIPLNIGGIHAYSNVQPAHYRCNSSKSDRLSGSN
ncbi:HNH endonuclease [Corynebacterium variabile]|uniref:HNH endonuclease n=1 Tax=Corynebacterium variabile TaxID=1727 RepID=UPI003FD6BA1E